METFHCSSGCEHCTAILKVFLISICFAVGVWKTLKQVVKKLFA